jgi:hypothetical protein
MFLLFAIITRNPSWGINAFQFSLKCCLGPTRHTAKPCWQTGLGQCANLSPGPSSRSHHTWLCLAESFRMFMISLNKYTTNLRSQKSRVLLRFILSSEILSRFMRSPCCLCACESPSYQLLNAWTCLYETWCVYHGIWVHLNGLLNKSLPSVHVSVCLSILPL